MSACIVAVAGLVALAGSSLAFETSPEPLVIETRQCAAAPATDGCPLRFSVELALTPADREQGLMNRTEMASDHGMLFRFDATRDVYMWMKNTVLPLDMVFIAEDGAVAGVAHDAVPFSETIIASPGPVRYVLELNAGVAAASGIMAGDRVVHPALEP
ncbi:DUF192 domain-containing protein [Hoeflea marina]|uniref:DUF192 domain-containing protein n=1 Tax=Hoeflea marina TaxID=274592 RepID=UPI001FE0FB49|nr:DUF192 domain-containing protein [Hoeflea marina]